MEKPRDSVNISLEINIFIATPIIFHYNAQSSELQINNRWAFGRHYILNQTNNVSMLHCYKENVYENFSLRDVILIRTKHFKNPFSSSGSYYIYVQQLMCIFILPLKILFGNFKVE